MASKIIFIALVVFFITTVCHAQGLSFGDFSTTSKTQVGDQQPSSASSTTQGNATNSTTSSTTASTDNNVESENSTVSDTNIDSTSGIDQDITSSTDAADLTTAEQ